jgi:hypothetical protein
MNGRRPFEYAVLRVIPRIERGESINAGMVLYCRDLDYLGARAHLDVGRLSSIDPGADTTAIRAVLAGLVDTCGPEGASAASAEEIGRRFRWLTAPRSTVVQPGPVHTGLTSDPAAELDRLMGLLVIVNSE